MTIPRYELESSRDGGCQVTLTLPYLPPFDTEAMFSLLRRHSIAGLDAVQPDGSYVCQIPAPGGTARAILRWPAHRDHVEADVALVDPSDLDEVAITIRNAFDLDANPRHIREHFSDDERLGFLSSRRPGLRLIGTPDPETFALMVILGQLVSLAAARTFQQRFLTVYGKPASVGASVPPSPKRIAMLSASEVRETIGIPLTRAGAVIGLASAIADGLDLHPGADPEEARRTMLAVRGIGDWTAQYISLRALRDEDSFPAGDLVLLRALGLKKPADAAKAAEPWRPLRGYATMHLWTQEASL